MFFDRRGLCWDWCAALRASRLRLHNRCTVVQPPVAVVNYEARMFARVVNARPSNHRQRYWLGFLSGLRSFGSVPSQESTGMHWQHLIA